MIEVESCPVCGNAMWFEQRSEMEIEEEAYVTSDGGEARFKLPFCNIGKVCNRVAAANRIDELAEPFIDAVGG